VRIRDGKVATETLRGGAEAVVLDGAGRLQIPRHLLEQAGIGLRAEVTVRGGDGAALLLRPAPEQTRG
jgi:DNA-binding transcriptional regulator/RsmH inhibitor MraZ